MSAMIYFALHSSLLKHVKEKNVTNEKDVLLV